MKRGERLFKVVPILSLLLLIIGNVFVYLKKRNFSMSGFSTFELIKSSRDSLFGLEASSALFFIQWVAIILISLVLYIRFIKKRKMEEKEIIDLSLEERKENETDIDLFYKILKQKKKVRASMIAKAFSIKNEKALEWAKILEDKALVEIEYPAFSEPKIIIKGNEK
jgi:hypothetical protein